MQKIIINNTSIAYEFFGTGNFDVVFIHGNHLSSSSFANQINDEFFLEKYRVLLFDLPGHGESENASNPAKDYSIEAFANTTIELLNQLKIKNPFLVGHSLGGHIAIDAASKINAAGLCFFGTPPLKLPLNMEECFNQNELFGNLFIPIPLTQISKDLSKLLTGSEDSIIEKDILRTDINMRKYFIQNLIQEKLINEYKYITSIELPLLIMTGQSDPLVKKEYFLKVPINYNSKFIVINGAHSPHIENSDEFNLILKGFIDEVISSNSF